ncbi:hypothetical protein COV16_06250 [Candidatus Woesearchaeota archaeon CG10_big_fil_rev_8_21_14_0_10_34_8]|nr:MAG: hypothetical protein COV16_06250 [Candidatus Woesearchaeota archaeon CG10_big_fil_rev_8_21_14_0_10_34_8]
MEELAIQKLDNQILIKFNDIKLNWTLTKPQQGVKLNKINKNYELFLPLNIFVNSFSLELEEKNSCTIIFNYNHETKILKLSSPIIEGVSVSKYNTRNIFDYEISHTFIVALSIPHFLKLLDNNPSFNIYQCYLLESEEKENLKYCLSLVHKFSNTFKQLEQVENILNEIINSFPIIFDYQLKKLLHILKEVNQNQYFEINMCIVILEELEKKEVLFGPSQIPEEAIKSFEEKTNQYINDYQKNNYTFFSRIDESNITEIKQLQKYTLQRIPKKLKKVRRYLEVIKNTQKPSVKLEIETKISVIKQIEINILSQDTDTKISKIVDNLLNLLDSIKLFFPLELQSILIPLFNMAKGVKSLYNIMEQFSERKEQQNHEKEELIERAIQIRRKQQNVLFKVESKCSKAKYVILFIKDHIGRSGLTYYNIKHSLKIKVSEEWVREVIQRLDDKVLEIINPHSRPHKISVYDIDEIEFWDAVDRCF